MPMAHNYCIQYSNSGSFLPLERMTDRQSLVERAHDAIVGAICAGTLVPGEPLRQERLADMLGVSRQPIHEALALLARQGLVANHGRRGVCVAPLDAAFVRQLYGVRGALDGLAAREAAGRTDAISRRAGRALIERGRHAVAAGERTALIQADIAFHGFVYECSGNAMIARTLDMHWIHIRRVMAEVLRSPDARPTSALERIWDEHSAILDAVAAGDAASAERSARAHGERAAAELIARLSQTDRTETRSSAA